MAGMRQEERRARTIDRLVRSAGRVISEGGYDRTTLETIAAHAGVSKGAVYAHFDSKLDLFLLVVDGELTVADERVASVASSLGAGIDVMQAPSTYFGGEPAGKYSGLMAEIWRVASAEPSVRHRVEGHRRRRLETLAAAAIDAGDMLAVAKQKADLAGRLIDAAIVEAHLEAARGVA